MRASLAEIVVRLQAKQLRLHFVGTVVPLSEEERKKATVWPCGSCEVPGAGGTVPLGVQPLPGACDAGLAAFSAAWCVGRPRASSMATGQTQSLT